MGQKRPPLIVTIQQILNRYSDGQIFKEMIQNADDAGASVVQFYLDHRMHGSRGLVKKELESYQGPALISANDAMFLDKDWKGIDSLHQSIKADDPFKVGRFGIGFNSVYHLTDFPTIISGNRIAFLDPQEKVWKGEPGQYFDLDKFPDSSDHLTPLHGIAGFNAGSSTCYPKTLFRFPLRNAASDLSENLYSLEKVNELINCLRSEAKLLLLFLRSIHTIEVYNINQQGEKTLSFQVKVADAFVEDLKRKRADFLEELTSLHSSEKYNFSSVIKFTSKFDISVLDTRTQISSTSRWLVAHKIDPRNKTVRAASVKQKVFPWVGTAVELGSPGGGRVFCFLPIPIETASNLPVHVNGTFGLNDDRRNLKWPVEWENDASGSANWNELLIEHVIPSCYSDLLLQAKLDLGSVNFYKAWPSIMPLGSKWDSLLTPIFNALLQNPVIWSESVQSWVTPNQAVYTPEIERCDQVVECALTNCGVIIAEVPSHVDSAFKHVNMQVKKVTPKLVRDELRKNHASYDSIDLISKHVLLKYCLKDGCYSELSGLHLLPLADGTFDTFEANNSIPTVCICTQECPKSLLPNLEHKLVDIQQDTDLQSILIQVAKTSYTQLKELEIPDIPGLLKECIPMEFRNARFITVPNCYNFPSDWFPMFWRWVQDKQLDLFANNFILPIRIRGEQNSADHFNVVKLSTKPTLYIQGSSCSDIMLSVLSKFDIFCCVQNQFSYVTHRDMKKLTSSYDANGVVDAIYQSPKYDISLTDQEAKCLRVLLGTSADSIQNEYCNVLNQLKIFTVKHSEQLYSNNDAYNQSLLKTSLAVNNGEFDITLLPSSIILFSDDDYHQNQLLKVLEVQFLNIGSLLISYIFPRITNSTISGTCVDAIMQEVLKMFNSLKIENRVITNLSFIKSSTGTRKTPMQLFDPSNEDMSKIFAGESVFPSSPYDQPKSLEVLKLCGLRTSITAQEVLDTIYSLSFSYNSPQLVDERTFSRAKALLSYLGRNTFYNQYRSTQCTLPGNLHRGYLCFPDALNLLSSNKCWLPILAEKPSCYPQQLPWKGEEYTSHLCTLNSTLSVSCTSKASHPELYGSQMYFSESTVESAALLSEESPRHLVEHLEVVISHINSFTAPEMMEILPKIYGVLQQTPESDLGNLKLVKKWIYIRSHNTFVDPRAVALEHNPSFRHNLEPYLHKLPDSLSNYSNLFTAFGVNSEFTKEQIISVFAVMREDIDNNSMSITADDSWNVVMAILNWLTENGTVYSGSLEGIFVPIESDSEWPDLQPANKVTYTDNEFLKNFTISSEGEKPLLFIHKRVNIKIAEFLQLTPLSKELDIAGDTFENTGQSEPLTTRLKNILRDYKDGITIVKELIQNADDALATEVNICYDARTHSKETDQLFYPGMAESHGQALVIHNNQMFSDEDFENITDLAGATKQNKRLKIGKFGIGFCSVYHITDIPSFISQDRLYIFDPTLNYLGNDGQRLKFKERIILNSKQLEPYLNLFGFTGRENYKNTMFRLPFRTGASELSGKIYSEATVLELLDEIYSCSESLILFLQHVKTITFQRINNGDTLPTTLFSVKKEGFTLPRSLSLPHATPLLIDSRKGEEGKNSKWLVSSYSTIYSGKDAVANVACELNSESNPDRFSPCGSLSGEIFCYLPLSQYTGLPVHVSSNFAVTKNRRGIWTGEECASAKDEAEVQWNNFLMESVIPRAYYSLLNSLKCMQKKGILENYPFYSLWPLNSELKQHNPWSNFVSMLYKDIETSSLFFSESREEWRSMKDCNFLDPNILSNLKTPDCVLEVLYHCEYPVVDFPIKYRTHVFLGKSLINEISFIALFFKHLETFDDLIDSRNAVIHHMLKLYASEYDNYSEVSKILKEKLTSNACIPCSPDGIKIKKVSDLIHPEAPFVKLYDSIEAMFPLEELVKRNLSELALRKLGIIFEKLPWNYIIERAHTVKELVHSNPSKCYERVKFIMEAITSHTDGKPPATSHIDTIEFLPVMKKPAHFPLNWPGDGVTLSCGKNMMQTGPRPKMPTVNIAGSQAVFLSEVNKGCSHISDRAEDILGLSSTPSFSSVLSHFKLIIINAEKISTRWISIACEQIYEYLDKNFTGSTESFEGLPYIWTEDKFIHACQVSKEWSLNGPYLYQVPQVLRSKESLCSDLGVKENFSTEDIQQSLMNMQKDYEERPLDKTCQAIFKYLIPLLHDRDYKDGKFLLPDEKYVLHAAECLAYNDAHWAPRDDKYTYVHDIIPRGLATKIGVKPVRTKFLDKYSSAHDFKGRAFGQKEDLTRRIQNILRDYPLDVTLLKELLQNADDAKATKMHIILDKRFHGTDSVLSKEWQDLQGPALLVWNDSVFSEKDLEGIQELGMGSKRSEAETIGHYGIGFNVVYHITDCPSFVTNGETLCVLDPHYRYVPGADVLRPGRRFDKINQGFWNDFPDVRSPYLRDNIDNLPPELLKGSLFRFPIRHDRRTISHSEITEDPESVIDVDCFGDELESGMKKMKEAMLFLNNISELKFCVIEEKNSQMQTVFHFQSMIEESATPNRTLLQTAFSTFKRDQECRSCAIMYPLTLTEVGGGNKGEDMVEKWLIQQGVGDIYKGDQHWQFINIVKPRHGIAAPLSITTKREEFKGQVFCFLPLPVQSGLPVHVNGHFILNSTRRELWRSTDIHNSDDRGMWNNNLVEALSSSYADFLYHARAKYVAGEYKNIGTALSSIEHYYSLFPSSICHKDTMWNNLALGMYRAAIERSLPVLCVLKSSSDGKSFITEWHPPKGITPASQVYCWEPCHYNSISHKDIFPILENIGMKITPATSQIMECFNAILNEAKSGANISSVTCYSIFEYYTKHSSFANSMRETDIEDTAFQNVKSFVLFTKYILEEEGSISNASSLQKTPVSSKYNIYPSSPFSHYLLLTADKTLRRFEENNKVLKSFHSELFPNSLHSFLHPELLDANYISSYFIQPDDIDSTNVDNLILEMIDNNFPQTLESVPSVANATAIISEDQMKSLWKCFAEDKVMTKHLSTILNHWAFLLTHDNRLFSFSSTIVPVYHVHSFMPSEIDAVMKKISMPFLNTNIVIAETDCPELTDSKKILSNFYAINQDSPLLQKLSRQDLDVMIKYFHQHLKDKSVYDSTVIEHLQSLPLFENIDGNYTSIWGKNAYIWPSDACSIAYRKWLEGHNAVFINGNAKWSQMGSARELSVSTIFTEILYTQFIFPHFNQMNREERYQHLEHIEDCLFNSYKVNSQIKLFHKKKKGANTFIGALKNLRCIGNDGSTLQPVSAYCDQTVAIFGAFSQYFTFLPDEYKEEEDKALDSVKYKWLTFFRQIGLKQTVSQEDFILFCQEIASKKVNDIKECSHILLHHLAVIETSWHQYPQFLGRISNIAFLQQEHLPKLTWLVDGAYPVNQMVPLKGSAPLHRAPLIWTVMPVVQLPLEFHSETDTTKMLGIIVDPSVAEVIENVTNICGKSQYAQISLFDNYPRDLICDTEHRTLLFIMSEIFSHLNLSPLPQNDLMKLQALPCIPVHHAIISNARVVITSQDNEDCPDRRMVLVKPSCVIQMHSQWRHDDVVKFHPYLHLLPDFKKVYSIGKLLESIGVKSNLELSHIQIALEGAFQASEGQELSMNTEKCVKSAIDKLYYVLHEARTVEETSLSPLYLPDSENKLKPSKSLLYGDTISYWSDDLVLDLSDVPYSYFNILPTDYHHNATDICSVLPESVRPIALSAICKQVVFEESREPEGSKLALRLIKTIGIAEIPDGVIALVNKLVGKQDQEDELKEIVRRYLEKIEVVTVKDLKSKIVLKESERCIGHLKIEFCYVPGETNSVLYLDSSLSFDESVYVEVANHLCSLLCESIKGNLEEYQKKQILNMIQMCLKCKNGNTVIYKLHSKFSLDLDGIRMRRFAAKLGEEIPECWHHRLDQDIDNVFNPMEYVGYEDRNGHIIVAQIAYPENFKEGELELEKKYKIYAKEDDEEGVSISILNLFKFLVGKKKSKLKPISAKNEDLAGEDGFTRYRASLITVIRKELCLQLREIWKLSPELRHRAVKRLYLKWHPDKHPSNQKEAEIYFKYLLKQLEHLEKGEPLDDPEAEEQKPEQSHRCSEFNQSRRWGYPTSNYDFKRWNRTAGNHSTYSEGERDFFSGGSGGSRGTDDSDRSGLGGGSGSSQSSSHFFPFDKEEDNKKPEEGERWVQQAEAEFKVLSLVHGQGGQCSGYFYVCFMAQQVAEKALKGGVYALCGMDGRGLNDHNLTRHAYALEAVNSRSFSGLVSHAIPLEDYYLKTRYPNWWTGYADAPADHYTSDKR